MLNDVLRRMSTKKLEAMSRIAKTRLIAFFKNPKHMIALRQELDRRKGKP